MRLKLDDDFDIISIVKENQHEDDVKLKLDEGFDIL